MLAVETQDIVVVTMVVHKVTYQKKMQNKILIKQAQAVVVADLEPQQISLDFLMLLVIVGIQIVLLKVIHIQIGVDKKVAAEVVQTPTVIIHHLV